MAFGKKLIIGGGLKDGERAVCITKTTCEDLEELRSNHEEADTRLLLHAKYATQSSSRIIVQSPDTDVLVLCAVHFGAIACDELWFKTGVKDHLRYIPVHAVSQKLGHKLCSALPAFHALTGCDTTSSLPGVGKKKAWVALCRSEQHQESLGMVGQTATLDEVSKMKGEEFICSLYPAAKKATRSADELRYLMFCQKRYKSELLPPTTDSVVQNVRRACYQAFSWRQALTAMLELPSPIGNGWEMVEGLLTPCFMTKNPAPTSLLELTTCGCKKSACQSSCSCANIGLPCTEACVCMARVETSSNPHAVLIDIGDESDNSDTESD